MGIADHVLPLGDLFPLPSPCYLSTIPLLVSSFCRFPVILLSCPFNFCATFLPFHMSSHSNTLPLGFPPTVTLPSFHHSLAIVVLPSFLCYSSVMSCRFLCHFFHSTRLRSVIPCHSFFALPSFHHSFGIVVLPSFPCYSSVVSFSFLCHFFTIPLVLPQYYLAICFPPAVTLPWILIIMGELELEG